MAKLSTAKNSKDLLDIVVDMYQALNNEKKQVAVAAKRDKFQNLTKKFQEGVRDFLTESNLTLNKKFNSEKLMQIDEQAWVIYQQLYSEIFGTKLGKAQKTEFLLFWRGGQIDLWDPYGSEAFYMQGDIRSRGVVGDIDSQKEVQVKKENGSFSLDYGLSGLAHQTKTYAHVYSKNLKQVLEAYLNIATLENMPDVKKQEIFKSPGLFVEEYLKLSAANWFLFYISNLNLWISMPDKSLKGFVESFPNAWGLRPEPIWRKHLEDTKEYKIYSEKLWFDGFGRDHIGVFNVPLSIYSFVHSAYPKIFYETRGIIVGQQGKTKVIPTSAAYKDESKIEYYNAQINEDFWDIHNSFFGPIEY